MSKEPEMKSAICKIKSRPNGRMQKRNIWLKKRCYNCGELGHLKQSCNNNLLKVLEIVNQEKDFFRNELNFYISLVTSLQNEKMVLEEALKLNRSQLSDVLKESRDAQQQILREILECKATMAASPRVLDERCSEVPSKLQKLELVEKLDPVKHDVNLINIQAGQVESNDSHKISVEAVTRCAHSQEEGERAEIVDPVCDDNPIMDRAGHGESKDSIETFIERCKPSANREGGADEATTDSVFLQDKTTNTSPETKSANRNALDGSVTVVAVKVTEGNVTFPGTAVSEMKLETENNSSAIVFENKPAVVPVVPKNHEAFYSAMKKMGRPDHVKRENCPKGPENKITETPKITHPCSQSRFVAVRPVGLPAFKSSQKSGNQQAEKPVVKETNAFRENNPRVKPSLPWFTNPFHTKVPEKRELPSRVAGIATVHREEPDAINGPELKFIKYLDNKETCFRCYRKHAYGGRCPLDGNRKRK